jgi:hypothetical protein
MKAALIVRSADEERSAFCRVRSFITKCMGSRRNAAI